MADGSPSFETRTAEWLGVREAMDRVLADGRAGPVEERPLVHARGLALARSLRARATLPPFDNSAMDGYAVRGADVEGATESAPRSLRVLGETRPGEAPGPPVGPGEAVRVMTGGAIPPGADSVIRVEHTDAEAGAAGTVEVRTDDDRGRHIRPAGQDMRAGEELLGAGTVLTPGAVAVAAALGHATVPVVRPPRVSILSTGDELRTVEGFDDVVAGRGIPDTNGPMLGAAVEACGAEAVSLGVARDRREGIRDRLRRALETDLLLTTGGASMGTGDLLKRVMEEEGLEVDFWRVRIRPGSPFSLARLPRPGGPPLPVLGLPGNPASAFVTFQVFARPLLLQMAGHARIHRRTVEARAGETISSTPRLTHFHRVTLSRDPSGGRRPVAALAGHPSSGLVRSLGRAHGLGIVPEGMTAVEPGESLEVVLLDDAPGAVPVPATGAPAG